MLVADKIFRIYKIMDAERNYRSRENQEPSFSMSSNTNATINNFNAFSEIINLDSQRDDKNSDSRFYCNSLCKESTTREASRSNVGENLQTHSVKHNSELTERSNKHSDADERHFSDHSKNDVQAKYSFSSYISHRYDSSVSCSKNIENLNNYLARYNNRVSFQNEEDTQGPSNNNSLNNTLNTSRAEKTTYCRPVYNCYNKEFVNKTIEKNIKLQKLLKKIVMARKREKEKEKWNNYVNELKNKHSYYSNEPRHISPQYVPRETVYPGPMNDFYNMEYYCNDPTPFSDLVRSVNGYNEAPSHEYYYPADYARICENPRLSHVYHNEQCCFPTSSQGRFMMLRRERPYPNMPYHTHCRKLVTPIVIDRDINNTNTHTRTKSRGLSTPNVADKGINFRNMHTQRGNNIKTKAQTTNEDCGCTPIGAINRFFKEKSEQTFNVKTSGPREETTKEKYERVTENVNRLKEKLEKNELNMHRKSSLKTIESKLDALMTSLNNFMAEMKSKKDSTSPSLTPIESIESSDNSRESSLPPRESSCFGTKRKPVTIVCNATNTSAGILQTSPFSNGRLRHATATTKINNILEEERDKSNKLRREIEELLPTQTNTPCVKITFDIPTKERATEVTNSLSKTKLSNRDTKVNAVIDEIISPNRERHRNMTIAVNTDPLGLLALFRVSSEAIKQLMSYVDYNWYFSMLPLRQVAKNGVLDYVCNICGDAFARPSQLSDHIQRHKLGNAKDCCVCRHALESKRCCSSLFGCQYCGQVFTRAYCCELHQQTCARRLGKKHDVSSSLVVLS